MQSKLKKNFPLNGPLIIDQIFPYHSTEMINFESIVTRMLAIDTQKSQIIKCQAYLLF